MKKKNLQSTIIRKLCIWHNIKKDIYYHRIVKGLFYESYEYKVGAINSYGHELVYIIDLEYQSSLKDSMVNKLISFLRKI